ncbi:hypothetical protein F5882DRAFT_403563 [Hyaloscypha sp. PMI_1271]|nr:hypothetical protein F5882DRAFT_403563 [Hyaloscypha sp. PMI_1271]
MRLRQLHSISTLALLQTLLCNTAARRDSLKVLRMEQLLTATFGNAFRVTIMALWMRTSSRIVHDHTATGRGASEGLLKLHGDVLFVMT